MKKLNFLMGLHCHQPVDNLEHIFRDAYTKSYEAFLSVLERHPAIKLTLHYSGSLLEWLIEKKPLFIERLKKLIKKSQIEILTGGYHEPILPMVPVKDARGQIEMLTGAIKKHFDYDSNGIWLAERVWDPALSNVFDGLNIRYTILDDFHLKRAGVEKGKEFGHYSVKGFNDFSVFASLKKLRYTMPFKEPRVTIDFLKSLARNKDVKSVAFADDCEKFGLWPYTYDWVYRKGWLEKFFTSLEKESAWIRTLTFTEALREDASSGEIEIPHSSYAEMDGWCEGNFNNFFTKYPESDIMRKRMVCVSRKLGEKAGAENEQNGKSEKLEKAKVELYKSQSNCAYWHGIFSGVYLKHLRGGVYKHIIKAEGLLDSDDADMTNEAVLLSDDEAPAGSGGKKENSKNLICVRNKALTIFVDPDHAGGISEIDYKPLSCNLVNTMSRRYEPYHGKLKSDPGVNRAPQKNIGEDEAFDLYDILGVREPNLKRFLSYDPYKRRSFLCHIMDPKTRFSDFVKSEHVDLREGSLFGPHKYKVETSLGKAVIDLERESCLKHTPEARTGMGYSLRLKKRITLENEREILVKFDLENINPRPVDFVFGVEFNWSIESRAFMRKRKKRRVRKVVLVDRFSKLRIEHIFEKPMELWSFPVYTLNESERGLGKDFQEISMLFHRRITLSGGDKFSLTTKVGIA